MKKNFDEMMNDEATAGIMPAASIGDVIAPDGIGGAFDAIKIERTNDPIKQQKIYSTKEIHAITGISERTLSQYFKTGKIKGRKWGGNKWFATAEQVNEFLALK